ncbi:MAG: hypothetical protein ABIP55_03605 [Tepidisphaeraceae bacterium]
MVVIRFPDHESERKALGWLPGRFSFTSRSDGVTIVPETALAPLALEGIPFSVHGRATYEQIIAPLRNAVATAVQ